MRTRLFSVFAMAVVIAMALAMWSATAGAQEETKKGVYQVTIAWEITRGGKDVEIFSIRERAFGDFELIRDRGTPLSIHAKLVSPDSVKFRLNTVPLIVRQEKPFSIVAIGTDGVGSPFPSIIQVHEMTGQTFPLAADEQLIVFDSNITHTIPEGILSGILRVNYTCETCPKNPNCLALD